MIRAMTRIGTAGAVCIALAGGAVAYAQTTVRVTQAPTMSG